jgi:simple sugar transport system permease protein
MTTLELASAITASAVRFATPLVLAATGETLAEKGGVVNVGIEGALLLGAATAFLVSFATGSVVLAAIAATLAGALLVTLFAALVLGLRVDQVVCGLGINLLAFGAAGTAYRVGFGVTGQAKTIAGVSPLPIPGLASIPVVGPALFVHEPFAYLTLALVIVVAWLVARSEWGLSLRATGDHPLAAESAGIRVRRVRAVAILLGGAFAGLAGADLVLAHALSFSEEISGGRGFMALALVLFGRWNPVRVALAALFFGAAEALEVAIKAQGIVLWGYPLSRAHELVRALPYLLTLLVLALPHKKRTDETPAALGRPYP